MGRVKDMLIGMVNKAPDYLEKESAEELNQLESSKTTKHLDNWKMPQGIAPTEEEVIEEYKNMVESLDPKLTFALEMVDEFAETEGFIDLFVRDPLLMKAWFGHISYKSSIENFNNLISDKDQSSFAPPVTKNGLPPISKRKKIKCITDLPLQSKLLN